MEEKFKCPLCGNTDQKYIGYKNGIPYCRLCISFRGKEAEYFESKMKNASYSLNYSLSNDQKELSDKLLENFQYGFNSFVHAVCGSGKTEIVLNVISFAISVGYKVGFAVPRKDVAIELFERFKNIFISNKVRLVCGGHSSFLYGDLVILTTHQLYRYDHFFDLLVLDEVDAFPFKGNSVLISFFERSLKGHYVMMSATPDYKTLKDFKERGGKVLTLFSRFHKHQLPIPQVKIVNKFLMIPCLIKVLKSMLNNNKQVLIFTPTIDLCESTYFVLKLFIKQSGSFVHSKKEDREKVINNFKVKKYSYLVTTAVLERGVTIKDLQLIVFHAEHSLYDQYSLVQISGRVGRKKDAPEGEVVYIATTNTKSIESSIRDIETANKDLQNMF